MSKELMDLLIAEAHANKMKSREFGDFLWFLRCTGARPGELRNAAAHNYDRGRLVFRWNTRVGYVHKTAKTTQRDRVIYLTAELQQYVEGLIEKHPTGKLFRPPRGSTWTLQGLCNKWKWLLKRPKVAEYLVAHDIDPDTMKVYNFRHSWASDYRDATGDIFGCAQMLGTSVKMIQTRYGHPDVEKLHEKYMQFMAGR